jgi:hypothetical protein
MKVEDEYQGTYGVTFFYAIKMVYFHIMLQLRGGVAQGAPSTATIYELLCVLIWVLIIPDSSTRLSGNNQQTSDCKGETWRYVTAKFAYELSLS